MTRTKPDIIDAEFTVVRPAPTGAADAQERLRASWVISPAVQFAFMVAGSLFGMLGGALGVAVIAAVLKHALMELLAGALLVFLAFGCIGTAHAIGVHLEEKRKGK